MAYFNRTSKPGGSDDNGAAGLRGGAPAPAAPAEEPRRHPLASSTPEQGSYDPAKGRRGAQYDNPRNATRGHQKVENEQETTGIGLVVKDELGRPVDGVRVKVTDSAGKVHEGTLSNGSVRLDGLAPGAVKVVFLDIDAADFLAAAN